MKHDQKLTSSLENYIRAVYFIVKEKKAARVKDISKHLSVGASSVTEALKNLSTRELINYEPYGIVTLTESGEKAADEINKKHEIICNFLENVLLVDKESVESNTDKIMHNVSEDVLEKFLRFLTFMQTCSCKEPKWIKSFKYYSQNGELQSKCNSCVAKCKANPGLMNNNNCCGMSG